MPVAGSGDRGERQALVAVRLPSPGFRRDDEAFQQSEHDLAGSARGELLVTVVLAGAGVIRAGRDRLDQVVAPARQRGGAAAHPKAHRSVSIEHPERDGSRSQLAEAGVRGMGLRRPETRRLVPSKTKRPHRRLAPAIGSPINELAGSPAERGPKARQRRQDPRVSEKREQRQPGADPPRATTVTWGLGVAPRLVGGPNVAPCEPWS